MEKSNIILHLDMNSYFASCEQQANPHLRGRPVGVCEHLGGIIIAPSVEAKRMGIKLGTPVWVAKKICPWIVLLPVDPDKYRGITQQWLRILFSYTSDVEKASIDEAFMDLTELCKDYDEALFLGLEIKQKLRLEIGKWISCSIGVGPNKLLAKIAADLGAGDVDRICVIRPEEIAILYEKLKLTDIPGIADRLERALNKLGIFTLKDLANYSLANLINQFGIMGYELHRIANFDLNPSRPSATLPSAGESNKEEVKSIGHMYTLPKPIDDLQNIKKLMFKLTEKIGRRMRRKNAWGNVVHYFHSGPSPRPLPLVGERDEGRGGKSEWVGFSRQHKIKNLIDDGREIYRVAWKIFETSIKPSTGSGTKYSLSEVEGLQIKIMGISVSGLSFDKLQEPLLENYKKPAWLVKALDKINDKYGEFTIRRGRLLNINPEWAKDTVGFGRMKEFSV